MRDCQLRRITRVLRTDCLERQGLSRTYLAHHELESVIVIVVTVKVTGCAHVLPSDDVMVFLGVVRQLCLAPEAPSMWNTAVFNT